MSKTSSWILLIAIAFASVAPLGGHASDLQSEFVFARTNTSTNTDWSIIPFLSSFANTEATLTSPDQFSTTTTNQGAFNGSYTSFQDLTSAVTSGPWSLVIDPNGIPQDFNLTVSLPNLSESLFGPVTLTTPTNLSNLQPNVSNFSWNGPSGYSTIDFIVQDENFSLLSYDTFAATQTSFTLNSPLLEGNYRLTIRYVTELTDFQVLVSEPEDSSNFANTGVSWGTPQIKAWSLGSYELSVIPEPSAALLVGLSLCGFGFRRSRHA